MSTATWVLVALSTAVVYIVGLLGKDPFAALDWAERNMSESHVALVAIIFASSLLTLATLINSHNAQALKYLVKHASSEPSKYLDSAKSAEQIISSAMSSRGERGKAGGGGANKLEREQTEILKKASTD